MNIFRKAARYVRMTVMRWIGAGQSWWQGISLGSTSYDYESEVGDGRGNSIVMACTNWIARSFPEAPPQVVELGEDGAETALVGHPMIELLEQPNDYYPGELLMQALLIDRTLTGNAYIIKRRNAYGEPVQLWWAPEWAMTPEWPQDGRGYISYYEYNPNGEPVTLDPADVIHFRWGLDPQNTRLGLSPLASLFREIFTDNEAANFSASLLRNMAVPGVIIAPGSDSTAHVTEDDAEYIKEKFKSKFGGDHRGEPMVFPVAANVQTVSFSPEQMNLHRLRQIPEERVSAVLGIPAAVVGLGTGLEQTKVGATMSELREMAWESNIVPTQRLMAAELKTQLLADFEDDLGRYRVGFDSTNVRVLQDDQNELYERVDTAVQGGWLTVARAKEMVGEVPDPEDNVYLRKMNVMAVPAGEPEPEPEEEERGRKGREDKARDYPGEEQIWEGKADYPRGDHSEIAMRVAQQMVREAANYSDRFQDDVERGLINVADVVMAYIDDQKGRSSESGKASIEEPSSEWPNFLRRLLGSEIVLQRMMDEIKPDIESEMTSIYTRYYTAIFETTVGTVSEEMGLEAAVDIPDPVARQLIREGGEQIVDITEQTREAVANALAEGREAGDGAEALARRIRNYIEGSDMYPGIAERRGDEAARQYRAETIARTETKRAQNTSSIRAYEAMDDIVEALEVFDGPECGWETHDDPQLANGMIVTFREAEGHLLAHPRCVRSFGPVVKEQ